MKIEFYVNMLVEWKPDSSITERETATPPLIERILFLHECSNEAAVINIFGSKAFPFLRNISPIREALTSGKAVVLEKDPYERLLRPDDYFTETSRQKRNENWIKFKEIISEETLEFMVYPEVRAKKITACQESIGLSKATIYKFLRRWWQAGRIKNALIPEFDKCGGRGKHRITDDPNSPKLGRPRLSAKKTGERKGIRITPKIEKKFEKGTKRFYETAEQRSLEDTFELIKITYFWVDHETINGVMIPVLPPDDELPTLGQYIFWYYNKYRDAKREYISRHGEIDYQLNVRPITGNSTQTAFGPGSICQFDSTPSNIALVNSLDRTRIVGRPITHVGIDTFSHAIMGFSSILESASYQGAILALDNIATDKVTFCAKFGVAIERDDWPCDSFPMGILADRGELKGSKAENILNLGSYILTTPPRRADLKPIIERGLGRIEQKSLKFMPGYIPHPKQRCEPDYMLKAALTINEFRQLMILYILEYNNFHWMKNYKKDKYMISDQVKKYPLDIWNWGIQNRSGYLRIISQDIIRLNLLPRKTVSVTPVGIHLGGELYYTCESAIREGWFERTRKKGMKVEVAFHPGFTDVIYLPLDGGTKLETCYLTEASKHLAGRDMDDANDYFVSEHIAEEAGKTLRTKKKGYFHALKEKVCSTAIEETQEALQKAGKVSKKSRKENIRANRAIENLMDNPFSDWFPEPHNNNSSINSLSESDLAQTTDEDYVPRHRYIDELRKLQGLNK
jgi:putative transposase